MEITEILEEFGLADKESKIYLALLELGPSPARAVARNTGINRGTAYDILKKLVTLGLASFYRKGKQHFAAEPPERLIEGLAEKQQQLERLKGKISEKLPELKARFVQQGGRPTIRVYEGTKGVKKILEDVLNALKDAKDKQYYVYSSATAKDRQNIYRDIPDFNDRRMDFGIKVKTISLGGGGSLSGLDDRKWLNSGKNEANTTHAILYAGKVAHIGLDDTGLPFGVIIENRGIYETQKLTFESLWKTL